MKEQAKLIKQDGTTIAADQLSDKILRKLEGTDEDLSIFCIQETVRTAGKIGSPIVQALLTINKNLIKVFGLFFEVGYVYGSTVTKNELKISVDKEIDAGIKPDSEKNIADNNTNND